jgi:hypothetical protein
MTGHWRVESPRTFDHTLRLTYASTREEGSQSMAALHKVTLQ